MRDRIELRWKVLQRNIAPHRWAPAVRSATLPTACAGACVLGVFAGVGPVAVGAAQAESASPGVAVQPVAIQPLGTFHRGEAVARDGERWLALWWGADAGHHRLAHARVRVARVHDPILDEADAATGEDVSVPERAAGGAVPVLLLRGRGLKPGPVAMAEIEDRSTGGLPAYALRHGGREFHLRTSCRPRPPKADAHAGPGHAELAQANPERSGLVQGGSEQAGSGQTAPGQMGSGQTDFEHADCQMEWIDGDRRQTLVEMLGMRSRGDGGATWMLGDDASPHLLFAGDIDGDGRLDLLIDTTDHYNLSRPTLFLSSPAAAGEALRRVAEHHSVGC